jgi:hypothetical protein
VSEEVWETQVLLARQDVQVKGGGDSMGGWARVVEIEIRKLESMKRCILSDEVKW